MKSQYLVYTIVALIIAGVAYWAFMGRAPIDSTPTTSEPVTSATTMAPVTINLDTLNDSGMSGTATFTEADGKTTVDITVTGQPAGSIQPTHIHMGACPTPGNVVYPLTNVVGGKSSTTFMATLSELKAQLPLAINLHKSATDMGTYTVCGDLAF